MYFIKAQKRIFSKLHKFPLNGIDRLKHHPKIKINSLKILFTLPANLNTINFIFS